MKAREDILVQGRIVRLHSHSVRFHCSSSKKLFESRTLHGVFTRWQRVWLPAGCCRRPRSSRGKTRSALLHPVHGQPPRRRVVRVREHPAHECTGWIGQGGPPYGGHLATSCSEPLVSARGHAGNPLLHPHLFLFRLHDVQKRPVHRVYQREARNAQAARS